MFETMDKCPICGAKMRIIRNDYLEFRARCIHNHTVVFRRGLEET